jgi:hypothetical protein
MAVLNQAKYLSFDHQYVETVEVSDEDRIAGGVFANRFVKRNGGYPAANGYAAGVSLYDIYGIRAITGYPELELTGTIAIAATTGVVTGSGTAFNTELYPGAVIKVLTETYTVVSIASATSMVVELVGGGAISAVTAGATATRLAAKGGYDVTGSAGLNLVYEDRLNASGTPYAPRVFPYQKHLSVVTTGIAIVEVAPSQTIVLDDPIASASDGKATKRTSGVVLGRALDSIITGANDVAYIRVKLGNEAGA